MTALRILTVAHEWPTPSCGGTGLYAAALTDALQESGHNTRSFVGPADGLAFRECLADFRPQVVHFHHLIGLPTSLPEMAKNAGARTLFTLHDRWLRCLRGQHIDHRQQPCTGPGPIKCARCTGPIYQIPLRVPGIQRHYQTLKNLPIDRYLSPTLHLAESLQIPALHLPLPLPTEIQPAPPASPGPVRFLCLGAQIPTKGFHLALQAFARLPHGASLSIVGPTPDFARDYANVLQNQAQHVAGVRFFSVPPKGVSSVLSEHDVLVFPSIWQENSPLVVLEAQAAGLPILGFDQPALRELAPEAMRVAWGSVAELAAAMQQAMQRGRERRAIKVPISWVEHVGRLIEIYRGA